MSIPIAASKVKDAFPDAIYDEFVAPEKEKKCSQVGRYVLYVLCVPTYITNQPT